MIIALTGTPGIGKTTVAEAFAKRNEFTLIDMNLEIEKNGLYCGWDSERKCWIADMKKVKNHFKKFFTSKKNIIIDSHLSHELPADLIIVLRCNPKKLKNRMKKKKWDKKKIDENLEAEFIGLIAYESRQLNKSVYEIDTTNLKALEIVKIIEDIVNERGREYMKKIDWVK